MKVKTNTYCGCINYYITEPYNFVIQINNSIKKLELFRSNITKEESEVDINDKWVQECYEVLLAQEQVEQLKNELVKKFK